MQERLTGTEAIKIVGQMLRGYANGGAAAGKSYIGALAEVLGHYPRSVALRAGDLVRGVPRDTKFLPTPADVIAWCEREKAELQGIVDRDDHYSRLVRDAQKDLRETERHAEARKTRPTYDELKAKYGPNWGIGQGNAEADQAIAAASAERMRRANETLLYREYAVAGIDPIDAGHGIAVSPELHRQLSERLRQG